MKNLLITGGCGFIGSNYINYIFKKYNDVRIISIDAMYYCASETNIEEGVRNSERYILVKGNLCSYDLVYHIIEHYKIDHIIYNCFFVLVEDENLFIYNFHNDWICLSLFIFPLLPLVLTSKIPILFIFIFNLFTLCITYQISHTTSL